MTRQLIGYLILTLALNFIGCTNQESPSQRQVSLESSPTWASFMSGEEYTQFQRFLKEEYAQRLRDVRIQDGVLSFPEGVDDTELGLAKLAQSFHESDSDSRRDLIERHVKRVEAAVEHPTGLSYEQAKDRLLVRLIPSSQVETTKTLIVSEELPGIKTVLVVDLPETVRSIGREEAKSWGKTPEELLKLGLANLAEKKFPQAESLELIPGLSAYFITQESLYVASKVLTLESHPEWLGRHGALVGVPTRQHLIVYPVEDSKALAAMELLSQLVVRLEEEGPGSVSPLLFYYDGDSLEAMSNRSDEDGLSLSPSPKFMKALAKISKNS